MSADRCAAGSTMAITLDSSTPICSATCPPRADSPPRWIGIPTEKVLMAASTWPGIRGTGPVPKSLRPMEPNAAKTSTPSAAVHGTPTKIPAGPAIEVKAAALREDTIRSVSVWSPNRNKRKIAWRQDNSSRQADSAITVPGIRKTCAVRSSLPECFS